MRERDSLPLSLSSLPSFFIFIYLFIVFLNYSRSSTNGHLSKTAVIIIIIIFFFCETVHTFTLVSTSLQWSLSSVRKVAVVERFTCTGTGYSRRARWPWTSACCKRTLVHQRGMVKSGNRFECQYEQSNPANVLLASVNTVPGSKKSNVHDREK